MLEGGWVILTNRNNNDNLKIQAKKEVHNAKPYSPLFGKPTLKFAVFLHSKIEDSMMQNVLNHIDNFCFLNLHYKTVIMKRSIDLILSKFKLKGGAKCYLYCLNSF